MTVIVEVYARRLFGPAVIVALALIVKGYVDVGDGFSAGTIVGLAVALQYVARGRQRAATAVRLLHLAPIGAVVGLIGAIGVGFLGILTGEPPFTHAPAPGAKVIRVGTLDLSTAVVFDLFVFMLVASVLIIIIHHLATRSRGEER